MALGDRDYMRRPSPHEDARGMRSLSVRLIIVCVVVWLFVRTVGARGGAGIVDDLAISATALAQGKLWTVLAHAVTHWDTSHILFNCYGLWLFGTMVEPTYRRRTFLITILAAMVAGGLGHVLWSVGVGAPRVQAIGVSGVVMALVVMAALRFPNARMVLFPIPIGMPLWALGAVYVALDLFGVVGGGGNVAHGAHLGGAAAGALAHLLTSGRVAFGSPPRRAPPPPPRDDPSHIDALLEKIHREGIGSLTDAEREYLNRITRR